MKILGISDEHNTCECCGRADLKCTVAIEYEDGLGVRYLGRQCAATALMGNKKSASMNIVESTARGITYAKTWLNKTPKHTAEVVANAIRVRFTGCSAIGNTIEFPNGVIVS